MRCDPENSLPLLDPDGNPVPFDAEQLESRTANALERAGTPDPDLADSISLAVECALREKRNSGIPVRSSEPVSLAVRILRDIGRTDAANILETAEEPDLTFHPEDRARIRAFLREQFPDAGDELERTEKKVMHTLLSIGAETARPALIGELARHFLRNGEKTPGPVPVRQARPSPLIITGERIVQALTDLSAREWMRRRILAVSPFDLRVFPVLRFEIRLSGLKKELPPGPLTELALAPFIYRIADAMDAVCLAADAVCSAKGHGEETPLKTALHFPDAASFAQEFMGYEKGDGPAVSCMASLASLFCSSLTRRPVRVTFHPGQDI